MENEKKLVGKDLLDAASTDEIAAAMEELSSQLVYLNDFVKLV